MLLSLQLNLNKCVLSRLVWLECKTTHMETNYCFSPNIVFTVLWLLDG